MLRSVHIQSSHAYLTLAAGSRSYGLRLIIFQNRQPPRCCPYLSLKLLAFTKKYGAWAEAHVTVDRNRYCIVEPGLP